MTTDAIQHGPGCGGQPHPGPCPAPLPELGGPPRVTVGVSPNTAMAAGCALARASARYQVLGWVDDADALGEIAVRLAQSLARGGWPDAAGAVAAAGAPDAGGVLPGAACGCGAVIIALAPEVHAWMAAHATGPDHHVVLRLPGASGG